MTPGLKIFSVPAGNYPYTYVGWLRRVEGDEWEALGARIIRRYGQDYTLAQLAQKGPLRGAGATQLNPPAREELHRLLITRAIPADEEAWAKDCPIPAGWR